MNSRQRREQSHFDLQSDTLSLNGKDEPGQNTGAQPTAPSTGENVSTGGHAGKIEVSQRAIAHVASRAAQQSYGVVGLAVRSARPGWAELLRREEAHKGVEVTFKDGRVVIELYVVIEYGTRISEVARNIMSNVKFAVESALGLSVVQVNVNVQDIRVSET